MVEVDVIVTVVQGPLVVVSIDDIGDASNVVDVDDELMDIEVDSVDMETDSVGTDVDTDALGMPSLMVDTIVVMIGVPLLVVTTLYVVTNSTQDECSH